jgi:DNA methylase
MERIERIRVALAAPSAAHVFPLPSHEENHYHRPRLRTDTVYDLGRGYMPDSTPGKPALLDREYAVTIGEPVRLDKLRLLDTLRQLKSTSSTAALRRGVVEVRRDVRDARSRLRARARAEAVELFLDRLEHDLDQIAESHTVERAHYYVERLMRSVTEVRTSPVNDINLNRWKEYADIHTDSLWCVDQRDGSGVHTAEYWGNFIPQIPHQMMRRYTKKGEWVLDVFAGMGTTLIEGQRLGRNAVGIELQASVTRQARRLLAAEGNPHGVVAKVVTADSATVNCHSALRSAGGESVQLVILHPPYFDIIKFSEDERDLSNAPSVEAFLRMMGRVVDNVSPVLDDDRYLVLVIGDKYANGEWVPLGFQTMNEVAKRGFTLKSIIVKNFEETSGKRRKKELWKYRALAGGFYVFKHEYIFVFRK